MIDIVIPVHNLRRTLNRVYFSLYSLSKQLSFINRVYVSDSSDEGLYQALNGLIKTFPFVTHLWKKHYEFNKPLLYNRVLKITKAEWIMFTDCDYLFQKDLLRACRRHRGQDRLLLKEVKSLPNMNMSIPRIETWNFPKLHNYDYINKMGENLANGACQYGTVEWFRKVGGYDERMSGWSAMDNDMVNRAKRDGLKIQWIKESQILHQFHRSEKYDSFESKKQYARNQKLLHSDKSIVKNGN